MILLNRGTAATPQTFTGPNFLKIFLGTFDDSTADKLNTSVETILKQ